MMKEDFDIAGPQTKQIAEQEHAKEPAFVVKCQTERKKKSLESLKAGTFLCTINCEVPLRRTRAKHQCFCVLRPEDDIQTHVQLPVHSRSHNLKGSNGDISPNSFFLVCLFFIIHHISGNHRHLQANSTSITLLPL